MGGISPSTLTRPPISCVNLLSCSSVFESAFGYFPLSSPADGAIATRDIEAVGDAAASLGSNRGGRMVEEWFAESPPGLPVVERDAELVEEAE